MLQHVNLGSKAVNRFQLQTLKQSGVFMIQRDVRIEFIKSLKILWSKADMLTKFSMTSYCQLCFYNNDVIDLLP